MHDIQREQDIEALVSAFYGKVQQDDRLDYIFNDVAQIDWDMHLPNMVDFWSKLLFQTARYKGRPFRKHLPLPIKREDFSRWYGLFEQTVDELYAGERADYAKEMASKIAASFSIRLEMEGKFENNKKI